MKRMASSPLQTIRNIPEIAPYLGGANHIDVKTVESKATLREFVAGMVAFQPSWLTLLYTVRGVFVRLLGMRQAMQPVSIRLRPDQVPMEHGQKLLFFTVRAAQPDRYLMLEVKDSHLDAVLGVVAEPVSDELNRFHVVTIVRYNNWAGPVYFNIIRPFHLLVVGAMARAGANNI